MEQADFKFKPVAILLLSAFGMLVGSTAMAADTGETTGNSPPSMATPAPEGRSDTSLSERGALKSATDMRASKLIGMRVVNAQNENLGKIDDVVVDINNERVSYAVLAFGGALGVGDKLFAYPLGLFEPSADRKDLVLNLDQEKLKAAPGFERKNWPDWNTGSYLSDVDRYFGPSVSPKSMPNQRLARASDLIGKKVEDRGGKRIGKINDVVVNPGNGKLHYVVLDIGKPWTINDTLVPMSMASFTLPADHKKNLVANVNKDQIDLSHGFKDRQWPDLNDPAYQRRVDTYLSGQPTSRGAAGPIRE